MQVWQREQATLDAWRRLLMGGFGGEVLFVNSHGVCTQFGLASGGTATAHDVPVFDRPAMVHFIHSFSLEFPQNSGCVGSVFLDHGAYAYFGSVYEPLLSAFVPPELIAQRAEVLVPFAIAARQFEGPLARPWRVMSYGDPLTLMASPKKIGLTRIAPTADGIETLRDASANALKRFRDEKNAEALVDALERHPADVARAIDEYQHERKPNADAIADMALTNFVEMRDRTAHRMFKLKKKLDHTLNHWMPNAFIPLYDLVSFSTVPYAAARARAVRQDRMVVRVGIAAAGLLVAALAVGIFTVVRRMFAAEAT